MADDAGNIESLEFETPPSPEKADVVDARLELVSDLEERLLKEGLTSGTTRERLALFQEVVSNDDLDEAESINKILKANLDSLESEPIEAMNSLEEASGYVAAFMLAKNRPESATIHSMDELIQLGGYAETAVHRKLAESWKLLSDNPESALGKLFQSDILPSIINEANALAAAAVEAKNFMSGAPGKAAGWVKEQFKERPAVAGSIALAGGIGLGALLYRTIRKHRVTERVTAAAGEARDGAGNLIETGGKIVKRTAGLLSYLPHALVATGGLAIAGVILGTEQTQSYLEREMTGNLAFIPELLYKNRVPATFIHLCSNRPLDALGTFAYGGRDEKSKMRHEVYAKYFKANDKQVWALAGVTVSELLEADPSREFPIGAGFLQHIPFLNTKLAELGVKPVEDRVREKLLENMTRLIEIDAGIKNKTVDEALRIAFAEGVFDSLESEVDEDENPEAKALVEDLEGYDSELDEIAHSESLTDSQIETLQTQTDELYEELDELRLAMPSHFSELKKAFGHAFPIPMVELAEDQEIVDYTDDVDLIATQEFYEQFADQVLDAEASALMKDIEELQAIQSSFADLKPGEAPSEALSSQIETVKLIHRRMETWKFRAEESRKESFSKDAEEWNAQEDMAEIATFYYLGYTSIPHVLQWSVKEVIDPSTGLKKKTLAVAAGVGASAIALDASIGAYQVLNGNKMKGAIRILTPGPTLAYDVAMGLRNFGHIAGYNTPHMLLEKFIRGQMSADQALHLSQNALRHKGALNNVRWTTRMKGFEDVIQILDNNAEDVARYLDDPSLARAIDQSTDALQWQKALRNLVKDVHGESLEEFFGRMKVEKSERLASRISPQKLAQMINTMARRFGFSEIPFDDLVKMLKVEGPVYSLFKMTLSRGARIGLPAGAALLTAYFACDVVHTGDKSKGDKFAMLGAGLIAAEYSVKAGMAARGALHGTAMASRISKHPYMLAIGAVLGLVGISYAAEKAVEPLTKTRHLGAVGAMSILGDLTYLGTGGQIIDVGMHHWGDQTEKEYFMRTTYMPTLPWDTSGSEVHLAFKDADAGYFNEMSPQEAINVYNYKLRQKIKGMKEEKPENQEEAAELEAEILLAESRIIDHNWTMRKTIEFDFNKASIQEQGVALEQDIFEAYSDKLTNIEKAYVSSLLTIDVPHSWMDEEFSNIEDEPRVALIRRLTKEMGIEEDFDAFIAAKRSIQSDVKFYQLIDMEQEIVHVDQETKTNRLLANMGIFDEDLEVANEILEQGLGDITIA